jgi:hypothetical protein
VEFHGVNVTSDAGLIAYRELDDVFDLTKVASDLLGDNRTGANKQHTMKAMLRQSVFGRLAGYEDTNDADRLRLDPAMRHVVGGRAEYKFGASTSEMSRFETDILAQKENVQVLIDIPGLWVDLVNGQAGLNKLVLDMDSSESPTHGKQQGSAFNGYFNCNCYHPLFCFNQYGDLERAILRRGNVHSAKFWRRVLLPIIERYRERQIPKYFRGDAAFASPALYRLLESEEYQYAIRLPSNDVLVGHINHLMTRPVGRPSRAPKVLYHSFQYKAGTWSESRRVVAKVAWHSGELFPRIGFVVTNLNWRPKNIIRFYNKRGTAEQWIKEGKYAVNWTRLSCHEFKDNQVRLQLFALAYNLGNFLRRLALPRSVKHWSMTTLREKLIKIGAKVALHARYVVFQMAEVAVPKQLFQAILGRIHCLRSPAEVPG